LSAAVVWRMLPHLRCSPRLINWHTVRLIGGYSIYAFVIMIAGRIAYRSDAIVIGAFLAPEYITYFLLAASLTEWAKDSVRVLTSALTPAISALEAQGKHDAIRNACVVGTRYMLWIILPIAYGLIVLGKQFLTLWMGPDIGDLSYPTLWILSV